jgi:hypothetical protein
MIPKKDRTSFNETLELTILVSHSASHCSHQGGYAIWYGPTALDVSQSDNLRLIDCLIFQLQANVAKLCPE